jgi:hypothetical protein
VCIPKKLIVAGSYESNAADPDPAEENPSYPFVALIDLHNLMKN